MSDSPGQEIDKLEVFVVDPALFTLPYDRSYCHELAKLGVVVSLFSRRLRSQEVIEDTAFDFHAHFYPLSERGREKSPALLKPIKGLEHALGLISLARHIARERPQIVHLQWLTLPLFDILFLKYIRRFSRILMTVHNSEPFHDSTNASKLQVLGEKKALLNFDGFFVHTEKTRRHLQGMGIDDSRIQLQEHPPISMGSYKPRKRPRQQVTQILFFGAIKTYKGLDILVEAAIKVAKKTEDFRIKIAGRPFMDMRHILQRIEDSGHKHLFDLELRFLSDDELAQNLDQADLVVFPYRSIDASGAFATAVDRSVPIIATEVGVFSESSNREYLTLVPPENIDALCVALENAIMDKDQLRVMGEKANVLRSKYLTWESFAKQSLEFYRAIIASTAHSD